MSLLTSQMTPKMSTAYSGLSALIQAATSQLSELSETSISSTNSPEGSPPLLSNPTTPTLEGSHLYLDGTSSWDRNGTRIPTVTPVLTTMGDERRGSSAKLLFPEVLMLLLENPGNEDVVTFLPDGKYFAVRRLDFVKDLLHKNFQLTTFEDFLDEARGWGFNRVNGNTSDNSYGTSKTNDGDCTDSSKHSTGTDKDDIYVFRHPYFEKNQSIDIEKMRRQMKTKVRLALEQHGQGEVNNVKRQLPPSADNKDVDGKRQRFRIESSESSSSPIEVDPSLLSGFPSDEPTPLRRRSSLEIRGVAQAITASKLQLNSTNRDFINEQVDDRNQESSILSETNRTMNSQNGPDHNTPKQERRQSTASLVDGGVETATQNIVTDAIEALLFDECHTRQTYNRHEKELSVSALPGVVPISKQLFSANDNSNATESSTGTKRKNKTTTATGHVQSLEDASRRNVSTLSSCSFSSNTDLKVTIPNNLVEAQQRRKSTDRSMVVSPARMEAAAALVSQSRNRSVGC